MAYPSADELLRFATESGILSLESVQQSYEMAKRQKYLEMHDHKVWQSTNGRWCTYLITDKGRKLISKASQSELEDVIINHYRQLEDNPTIPVLFRRWNDERYNNHEIGANSYSKYNSDFKRFFLQDDKFCNKPVTSIKESDIVEFIKLNIVRYELTQKVYSGLRLLIIGIFKYAKLYKYTEISISTFFGDLQLSRNLFKRVKKRDADCVFSDHEADKLRGYFIDHPTVHNLGLFLMFDTGLRIGELVALKPENITPDGILVNSTEIYYKDPITNKTVFTIKDCPKGGADDRTIAIPQRTRTILKRLRMLNPSGEYIFMKDGKRINSTRFNYWLYKACDEVGIPRRSTHKIRKTYASKLIDARVEDSIIKSQMGHRHIETTRGYYYFQTHDTDYLNREIERAIK